ncbi:undecaprenyl-phosphate alpha-N-acetylglucosaminyl 1-phosphate transferase [Candidatus Williamhamiltonella defendens]|uniref:Undecaprenyl-phosphate alpha-N-acetylglucosaminyl 1-phosphate transferase n=1 Tax=Candidatus Williamhamiltonella defendens TaxID=138072 RepID=A0A2D3T6Z7_9ENTR|nr:UDP-N-acetylglucosamine--undecaprenyl-phosphate N-acetylglucosaminephosphotransferase [Candidatus Hamiltonella defensa]ASV33532.1 undecaprenyl-phosphate alpha-N-acetylglucosaminyl 1-phosphate transferase [Candidatus Hamiltonella defensa]ATW29500.1 undecaprenyl-phosphate alpha-N-acetylglucosaminyl 1-phosphate transferase [Candidatus Hamiltonella defensa]ATW31483.1 undecaprenyl-phosphate alpha-N-acetylglucosaminyl 1-phosphate transferase [Candidatus Hamiltonella defensa]AWK16485.1 undecaprenyl
MNLFVFSAHLLSIFFFSLVCLLAARKVAKYIGLVDEPDHRKHHQGAIPLVGGISVYAGICFALLTADQFIPHAGVYLACAGLLVFVGVLDDRFNISVKIRLFIQFLVSVFIMCFAGLHLNNLGFIFGFRELGLGPFSYIITLLSVCAAINAFNMIDGIDGLLGGLSCVSFLAIGFLLYQKSEMALALWCFSIIVAITPYVLLNLGLLGEKYKIFMGDAGSTLIGFTIIWLLLQTTQGSGHPIRPVTVLWTTAVPLIDMIAITYRRLRKGMNPLFPDRQHLHHLMMRSGFTSQQTLTLIIFFAALCALIGIIGEFFIPEWIMFALFLCMFFVYSYSVKNAWRLSRLIKRINKASKIKK